MARGLPVTLTHLRDRLCLVVGGGAVAERKIRALLEAQSRVRVVAPHLTGLLAACAAQDKIEWCARQYRQDDLDGVFLVIAATDDRELNRAIARQAAARQLLVNAVDDPEVSNFISPAVVRRGELTIAVCTGGTAPTLSAHLRAQLEQEFGADWEEYVAWLGRVRERLREHCPEARQRWETWKRVLNSDLRAYIATHDEGEIRARIDRLMENDEGTT